MYSVSIIMPIYNNEKTLKRAIDSILNQSIYGFELILINDGSTDGSASICDEYAKKEPLLIEVIHQKHTSVGRAKTLVCNMQLVDSFILQIQKIIIKIIFY